MDAFMDIVRNDVMKWLGDELDDDKIAVGDEARQKIEEYWEYCVVTGLKERAPDNDGEKWWYLGGGRRYTKKAVKEFVRQIDSKKPTPADLVSAYQKAEKKLNKSRRRYQGELKILAPVLCPDRG